MSTESSTGTTAAQARARDQALALTNQIIARATGAQALYTLPNGQVRAAIVVRPIDSLTADIRVFCLGPEDAEYRDQGLFGSHDGSNLGVELLRGAVLGHDFGVPETWAFHPDSPLATVWPR
jgi:hypothetical protein